MIVRLLLLVLVLVLLPSPSWATLAMGGHTASGNNNSSSTITSSNITTAASGSGIICGMAWGPGGTPGTPSTNFTSFADSKSNTWTQLDTEWTATQLDIKMRVYYCLSCTGGASHNFTLTISANDFKHLACMEITTTNGLGVLLDRYNHEGDTASAFTNPAINTEWTDLLWSWGVGNATSGTDTWTAGNSFTQPPRDNVTAAASSLPGAHSDRGPVSAGSYNGSWTASATTVAAIWTVGFYEKANAGANQGCYLLENNTDFYLLENNVDFYALEGGDGGLCTVAGGGATYPGWYGGGWN